MVGAFYLIAIPAKSRGKIVFVLGILAALVCGDLFEDFTMDGLQRVFFPTYSMSSYNLDAGTCKMTSCDIKVSINIDNLMEWQMDYEMEYESRAYETKKKMSYFWDVYNMYNFEVFSNPLQDRMENLRTVYRDLFITHDGHIEEAKRKKKLGIDHEMHIDSAAKIAQELDMYVGEFKKIAAKLKTHYINHAPLSCFTFTGGKEKDQLFYERPETESLEYTLSVGLLEVFISMAMAFAVVWLFQVKVAKRSSHWTPKSSAHLV